MCLPVSAANFSISVWQDALQTSGHKSLAHNHTAHHRTKSGFQSTFKHCFAWQCEKKAALELNRFDFQS